MLNKVLKNLQKQGIAPDNLPENADLMDDNTQSQNSNGFHSKGSSQLGAKRARSIGNRMFKTSRKGV
jgi:hypothetical protein